MHVRPKVGLILLRAQWFDEVVALPELAGGIEHDTALLIETFPAELELARQWVVNSQERLDECVRALSSLNLDLILLTFQVWAEDFFLQPLVRALNGQPLAVWCYQPGTHPPQPASFCDVLRYSGPVGTLEGLGTLRNLGVPFSFLVGTPGRPQLNAELVNIARAGALFQALKRKKIGLLPSHSDQMQSTYVDEFRLRADLGPAVDILSIGDLERAAAVISPQDTAKFVSTLRERYPVREVKPETLAQAARTSLALGRLLQEHRLDVLSLHDISAELHQVMGLRPCFYPPDSNGEHPGLYGLEGDLGAATAMLALQHLAGGALLFVEFWFWDESLNQIVGGHAGIQNPDVGRPGEVFISKDYEFCQSDRTEGAHYQFACKPGRVTLLQLRYTAKGIWQAISLGGEVVDGPPRMEGYPHAVIRPDVNVLEFFRQIAQVGTNQHWIMAYGDIRESLKIWCEMEDIHLLEVR